MFLIDINKRFPPIYNVKKQPAQVCDHTRQVVFVI